MTQANFVVTFFRIQIMSPVVMRYKLTLKKASLKYLFNGSSCSLAEFSSVLMIPAFKNVSIYCQLLYILAHYTCISK